MLKEEIIDGVVYLVNTETGEKVPKSKVASSQVDEIETTPTEPVKTPLASKNQTVVKAFDNNLNSVVEKTKLLDGALSNQVEASTAITSNNIDKLKNASDLELPKMGDKVEMTDEAGNKVSFKDALPKFDEWREKIGWKLPKRSDDEYAVDKKEFKYEQTDREILGGQLQILGAMFQELGNPKLYKGQTAAVGEAVIARKDKGTAAALEKYQEAMVVAKANYEGDRDYALDSLDVFKMETTEVKDQIDAIKEENKGIQQEFDNAITIFDTKMKQFTESNKVVLAENDMEMANLAVLPSAIKESLASQINLGNAFVESMSLRSKMLEINQKEASLVQSLSKDFTAMNTVGDSRYGLSYEDKLATLLSSAGDSEIAQNFVNSFPETRQEYDKAESTNLMNNAEQIIGVATALGIEEEYQEYILAEKILGVKLGSIDQIATGGLQYPQEQIDSFIGKSTTALKVYETASGIIQQIDNGTYSASGVDKFITDSKIINAFASFGEAAGFDTDIQARFEVLKKETGGTQQAMAGLIVELIPLFTGEEGARKTTFDVTYTGEQIGSLVQQFEKGLLTTSEGQKNALELIKTIAKDSSQYNFNEAQNGKPTEPTDQLFADIDAKYSGGAVASVDNEDRANFKRLISNAGTADSLRSMFSKPELKAQVNNDIELKKDLLRQIKINNPDLPYSEAQALLEELLN